MGAMGCYRASWGVIECHGGVKGCHGGVKGCHGVDLTAVTLFASHFPEC